MHASIQQHTRPAAKPCQREHRSSPVHVTALAPVRRHQDRMLAKAADVNIRPTGDHHQLDSHHQQQPAASKCPFLAALPSPPPAQNMWWNRLQQLFNPGAYQAEALGPHDVVQASAQFGMPEMYVMGKAEYIKTVFSGENDGTTTVASNRIMAMRDLLGPQNLLQAPEPRHKYLRNLIMPAFTAEAIEKLVPRMETVLHRFLNNWADVGQVKAHDELRKMTFTFIMAVVMGRDYPENVVNHLGELYGTWASGLLGWPYIDLPFTRFGKAQRAKQELLDWFQGAVDEARADLAAGKSVPGILGGLVSAVDENGNSLTDAELGDNLLLILLAGHDTSSTTLTNTMANLQGHPHVFEKLQQEQRRLVAKHGTAITGSLLKEMVYADAVIRETLRLNNVVAGLMRKAAKDIEIGGYQIPEGTTLYLPLTHVALNDPRWVDDEPQTFKPERMMTPEGLKPGAQMPFGHGPRFCAGYAVAMAEMKVYLALLARGYDFQCDTNTEWVQEIGRKPKNGLPMKITRREPAIC
eukprot:GHUV01002773.1.p1 GENE.GHUV01002773.1~~GHUV01002773.1.p1  ORF type:complete len:523 (+),score=179.47 GHUV01002773.1:316-1884(+)